MTITEANRHHLLAQLEQVIGKEAAMTLAEHLPPVGWADVATTRDLDHLRAEIHAEMQVLRAEFRADLYQAIEQQSRHFTTVMVASSGLTFTGIGALVTLLHFLG